MVSLLFCLNICDRISPIPFRQFRQASNRLGYIDQMQNPTVSGFDVHIDGVWRTSRDQQPAAYEAALLLKQKKQVGGRVDNQHGNGCGGHDAG
jgi:hypothetical protein